jgi:hypothetical protein
MTGASAWMMTATWDISHLLLLWAMWALMMVGMMLPSASPMLLLYGVMARRSTQGAAARQIYMLAVGYLVVWSVFSCGVTHASAGPRGAFGRLAHDGGHQSSGRCHIAARRGRLSTYAVQARVPAQMLVAARIPDQPMAHRNIWGVHHGDWSTASIASAAVGR